MDGYLLHRTFLVGYSLSIADLAIWSGLAGEYLTYNYVCIHLCLCVCLDSAIIFYFCSNWASMGKLEGLQEISKLGAMVQFNIS